MPVRLPYKQVANNPYMANTASITAYTGPLTSLTLPDGRCYNYVAGSTITVDNGIVLAATGKGGGRWIGMLDGAVSVKKWYQAKGDGVTNDTAAIQTAVNYAKLQLASNGDSYRCEVLFPGGIYRITAAIDCTSANGLYLKGSAGKYVNVHIRGNTGGIMFDFTGSSVAGCEGFAFVAGATDPTPSTIGVQFALSEDANGNQIGGLNDRISNCYFQLDDMPTANGGIGSIPILNIRSEEFSMSDIFSRGNTGVIFSNKRDLSDIGVTYTASSPYAAVIRGTGSMGVVDMCNNISLQVYQKRRPALLFINANSVRFFGYIGRLTVTQGTEESAIRLYGQNTSLFFGGTIESFSQVLQFGGSNTKITTDIVTANQASPTANVLDTSNALLIDCDITVAFTITSEYTNGRTFLYHGAIGGGDSPATGSAINCRFNCGQWIDNSKFVSANLLKAASNCQFNTGQPFESRNGAIIDRKGFPISFGNITTGNPELGANLLRFTKADRTTKTSGNAGSYVARIVGTLTAGGYSSPGRCLLNFEATVLATQNADGSAGGGDSQTIIYSSVANNAAYLSFGELTAVVDLSGTLGLVRLYVKNAGTGVGEPVSFVGTVELTSNFAVNQSIILN